MNCDNWVVLIVIPVAIIIFAILIVACIVLQKILFKIGRSSWWAKFEGWADKDGF